MKLIAEKQERIDKYLIDKLDMSRSKIQRMIDSGNIVVNGNKVKSSYSLKIDDEININDDYSEEVDIVAQDIPLDIIYEDDYLLVINKPSGMVVIL